MDLVNNCNSCMDSEPSSAVLDDECCAQTGLVPDYGALFFGSLIINRDENLAPQSVRLRNVGNRDIGILSVKIARGIPNFKLAGNTVFPEVVRPGESFVVTVKVVFDKIEQLSGTIEINTNEDRLPYVIGLGGRVIGAAVDGKDGEDGEDYDPTAVNTIIRQEVTNLEDLVQREITSVTNGFTATITDERWAWTSAVAAEAGYRLTLAAQLRDETEARVMVEYIARVTAVEAEATARLAMEASVKGYTDASLVEERRVYASRFEAIASDRLLLEANMRDNVTARITEERTARVTALQAEATARSVLEAYFNGEFSKTSAQISEVNRVFADANGALAERVTVIESTYTGGGGGEGTDTVARARIEEVNTTLTNANGATASRVEAVNASYSYLPQANVDRYNEAIATGARVTSEAQASADRDGALGSRIDSVVATANGASAAASIALSASQDVATKLGQARVRLLADAGNGRAQLDLYSDSYGNVGVDIVGKTRFLGQNGGNTIVIDTETGFSMIAPNGVRFIELGIF